jgi:hypothetical protein
MLTAAAASLAWTQGARAAGPVGATPKTAVDPVAEGFLSPPNSARPRVWWHWMNGNVTEAGIKLDLEWMHRVGIGGLQNFDAQLMTPQVVEKRLSYMTPDWRKAFRYAASLSDELGLELAIASSPGWSETGGPWVKPEQGIKKFVWSEATIPGGRRYNAALPAAPSVTGPFQDLPATKDPIAADTGRPTSQFYADTLVVAYLLPDRADKAAPPTFTTSGAAADLTALGDGRQTTFVEVPAPKGDAAAWIRADYAAPRTIGAVTLGLEITGDGAWPARLEASDDGQAFRTVATFPQGGADFPQGTTPQHTISFPPVTARAFRVRFDDFHAGPGLSRLGGVPGAATIPFGKPSDRTRIKVSRVVLHEDARVHRFEQKAGFGVVSDYYALATPRDVVARAVAPSSVVDLTAKVSPDGRLDWTPPPGQWRVLRFGYSLTGKENHPATAEATGLEVDKLDRGAVKAYIETYLDSYAETTGAELMGDRGVRALLNDSIEVGPMNWTPDMVGQFKRLRGYDPIPWLPVLTGVIVGDAARSDAFLFDFRRTIGDLLADSHYGQIAESAHARKLTHYAEALEFGRPSLGDDMAMRRHADIPMGAMWTYRPELGPRPPYVADLRGAASVAHVYGQNLVAAESLTAAFSPWAFAPADLKPIIDLEFALGVNRPVIHTSVHQPIEKKPGLSLAVFGQYFNRHETWAEQARPWVDYLSRSAFMLQQGRFFADVAYFYGEEAPLTGLFIDRPIDHAPEGHGFDFVNADIVLNHFKIEDGALSTPSGMRYRVLYLGGSSQRMTLPVLRRIAELVEQGAVVVGERPTGSPSLADDPDAFAALARKLWSGAAGKGRVLSTLDLDAALRDIGLARDFEIATPGSDAELMFVHRAVGDGHVYFVSNRKAKAEQVEARFRVTGLRPEIWRATTGASEPVSYRMENGHTVVPLDLTASDALFVVFREATTTAAATRPARALKTLVGIDGDWVVTFEPDRGAPATATVAGLASLSDNADPGVRYFSGTATYRKAFTLPGKLAPGLRIDLGTVGDIAEVFLNGKPVGTSWLAPHRLDIAAAARPGRNDLEIRVTNLWVNRLIGDAQPGAVKLAFTTVPTYVPGAQLRPSGLIGPVSVLVET